MHLAALGRGHQFSHADFFTHLIERDEWLRRELQIGFDQADRGESEPLDIESIITELHEELDEQGRPK